MENLPYGSFSKGNHSFSYLLLSFIIYIDLQEVCKGVYIQRALSLMCFCSGVARTSDTVARSERLAAFAHSVAKVSAQNRKTQRDSAGTGACDMMHSLNAVHRIKPQVHVIWM